MMEQKLMFIVDIKEERIMEEITKFKVKNTEMVVVKTKGGASIMEAAEYKKMVRAYKKVGKEGR